MQTQVLVESFVCLMGLRLEMALDTKIVHHTLSTVKVLFHLRLVQKQLYRMALLSRERSVLVHIWKFAAENAKYGWGTQGTKVHCVQ